MPSPAWISVAVDGKVRSGRRGRADDEVDVGGLQAGIVERGLSRLEAEHRGGLVLGRDVALLDARALHDPFVRGRDAVGEILVRDDPLGEIGAASADDGTNTRHELVLQADATAGVCSSISRIVRMSS